MKRWFILLIILLLAVICWQCSEKSILSISSFFPDYPTNTPTITKSNLKGANEDYSVGYANGHIRSDRVTLIWTANTDSDFLCYKIFRKQAIQGWFNPNPVYTTTTASVNEHTDTDLLHDMRYDYKVAILNTSGLYRTDTVRVKTPQFLPPSDLSFTSVVGHDTLQVDWTNNAEYVTFYQIERSDDDQAWAILGTSTTTSFIDNTATSGTWYYYRILAGNSYESTPYSSSYYVRVN